MGYNNAMMNDTDLLKKRFMELSRRSDGRGSLEYSDFLSLSEQAVLSSCERTLPTPYVFFGGAEGCERRMARFGFYDDEDYRDFPIEIIEIAPRAEKFSSELTHRDYLGALMHLGVERERIGDIIVRGKRAYAFVDASLAPYFVAELESVGRTSVNCTISANVPQGELFRTEASCVRIPSLRLDALVAQVFKLSRTQAQQLFSSERVFINGAAAKGPAASPAQGDIISVRGLGRFVFVQISGQSKKGKLIAEIELYV